MVEGAGRDQLTLPEASQGCLSGKALMRGLYPTKTIPPQSEVSDVCSSRYVESKAQGGRRDVSTIEVVSEMVGWEL